jgi:hypothetical protein
MRRSSYHGARADALLRLSRDAMTRYRWVVALSSSTHVTPLAFRAPSAMLVAVATDAVDDVTSALSPLKVLKVAHVPAACERMIANWPLVVVLGSRPKESELEAIRATALDVSAQLVILSDHPNAARLRLELAAAKRAAVQMRDEIARRATG